MTGSQSIPDAKEGEPQIEDLRVEDQQKEISIDPDDGETRSVSSNDSEASTMEPFANYKVKIDQLLDSIGLKTFSIEPIQHGYGFMNCVYSLTSINGSTEQYILRVAVDGAIRDSDGKHETLENDIALLEYLKDRLLVPGIKAYSLTADNVLDSAYTVQTKIPGESLNNLWATMEYADKYAVVDEFINLLVKLESVKFAGAGTFAASVPLPEKANDFRNTDPPCIKRFEPRQNATANDHQIDSNLTGADVKCLLQQHLQYWIQEEVDREQHELSCAVGPRFQKLLRMIDEMDTEGCFKQSPCPIVLHHWDLEPRNLMVSKASGTLRICGIIDWDDALALPTPLARIPPRWIWHFPDEDPEFEDGYLNDDQYPDPELSDENRALKFYFDTKIEKLLPGFNEDTHGRGRWMRRIWHFAKEGAFKTWEWDFLDQLPKDWEAKKQPKTAGRYGRLGWIRAMVWSVRSVFSGKI